MRIFLKILNSVDQTIKNEDEKAKPKKKTEVTYDEVLTLQNSGTIRFIDVRDVTERAESGAISGSINIPCMS